MDYLIRRLQEAGKRIDAEACFTAADTIIRLEAERDQLRAELAEVKKPDCLSCNWYNAGDVRCVLEGGPAECVAGDCYEKADPMHLYETNAAMVEPTHWTRSLPIPGRKGEGE